VDEERASAGEHVSEAGVRALLPHTWHAFFGRFGRLRNVQLAAVPELVRGGDVLVVAPTASGKTEAVVAPLLERALTGRPRGAVGLAVVVVCPTRALCNDLLRRLRAPVLGVGLTVDIKTGDAPSIDADRPPNLLVTTPESLDSLLCRHTAVLKSVGAIALDEVHLVDGTARGDHVRCLTERLARVTSGRLQRCGASATVPEAASLARRYLGAGARAVVSSEGGGERRPIVARIEDAGTLESASAAIAAVFDEAPRRKLLVFANRRADVEALVAYLSARPLLRGRVFAHHGSLARGERLRVERQFLDAPAAIAVATTTLEIGIDIGDVDRVVLVGPPPNVSALLQRVGRGNRREAVTHAVCLAEGRFEAARFEHLIQCAAAGELFGEPVGFRPAVAAQQALSLVFQSPTGWISAAALHSRLPSGEGVSLREADCGALLAGLAEAGYLRAVAHRRYVADVEATRVYERGKVHSNVADSAEIEVVDELTGRALGTARFGRREREAARAGGEVALALGGRKRTVARVEDWRVVVRSAEGSEGTRFVAKEAPRYSFGLARSLGAHLGVEPDTLLVRPVADDTYLVAHFLGTVWGRVFGGLLRRFRLRKAYGGGPFFVPTTGRPEAAMLSDRGRLLREVREVVARDLKGLVRLLSPGAYGSLVPRALTERWVVDNVRPEALVDTLSRRRIIEGWLMDEDG
jgi:ATP-dependent helicase Lhr and Lhr-like helicase